METWEERYRRLMGEIWRSPFNDQRPAVLDFLQHIDVQNHVTLDVGAGDAYYLPLINPRQYVAIEPDEVWRARLPCLTRPDVPVQTYRNVAAYLANKQDVAEIEVALLCHVLLYLEDGEVHPLLDAIRQATVVMAHPDPDGATTIAFERTIGWQGSMERIQAKRAVLGSPTRKAKTASRLFLPGCISIDDIAFLISHRLPAALQREEQRAARKFVVRHIQDWRRDGWWQIPQPQITECYNTRFHV